jgi:hypothetical protein
MDGRMSDDDDILTVAKERFRTARDFEDEDHNRWEDDVRFARMGEQWPEDIRKDRENQGRPCLTINKLPTYVRQVVNDSRQNKPSIKVAPVDDHADPDTADVLNGLIRNIEVISNADAAYDTAVDNAVSGGFGYIRVNIDYAHDDTFDKDILIERVLNPLSVHPDPEAQSVDGSDWRYCFVTESMPKEEFEKKYPDADPVSFEGLDGEDREYWFTDDHVTVAQYWAREEVVETVALMSDGQVVRRADLDETIEVYGIGSATREDVFAMDGVVVVKEREVRSYRVRMHEMNGQQVLNKTHEWAGRYIPIVPVYGEEVVVEGRRRFLSLIHFAKDPQRMFNYWRSASTELVALAPKAPWVGPAGSFNSDAERWASANTDSHAYLEYDPVTSDEGVPMPPPQRQPFAGVPAGALQEAMNASDDIKTVTGLYDASMGARSNEASGKAIIARQREGDVSTFHFIDNLSRAIRQLGRIVVDLIPKVYSEARVVRVLGEDGKPDKVPVNQPVDTPAGPRIYDLATGKYDVTVKAGPSFTTQREESATQMMNLIQAFPQAAPVLGDILAKNLDWPEADEIERRLKALLPPQVQASPEAEMLKAELQKLAARLGEMEQDKALDVEKLRLEAREVDIKAFEAQTDRMKVQADAVRTPVSPVPGPFPG